MSETSTSPGAEPSQPVPDDAGRSASVTGKILRWSCIWLPWVYLVLLVGRLVTFDLPNNFDRLDESYEPLKTLKFVHSRSHALEKWGPMPNFLYAPIMERPDRMPDVLLMTTGELHWIQEFKLRPARNKLMADSGYSYNRFDGPESLGYRHVDTVRPEPTWLTDVPWYPWHKVPANEEVYVYRMDAGR